MEADYGGCLDYLLRYWGRLTCHFPRDLRVHIGLPNRFVTPTTRQGIFKADQFYWDSYFIILGLVESGKDKVRLARGMVENFAFLFDRFGLIPMRNRFYNVGISQPPFFTSMIMEVFRLTRDLRWLRRMIATAEDEYNHYWMDKRDAWKRHCVFKGLSRYCDHFVTHATAEHESGWDMTSRFGEKCLDYLPVDLNSCLYRYEVDFARAYGVLKDGRKVRHYTRRAEQRKRAMNELMWNDSKGFFFDYNYRLERRSDFFSLAGFYPLWAGLASERQAGLMRKKLRMFEHKAGLANTQKNGLSREFKQWDYPSGWPNQQWVVAKGLLDYGFQEDAKRIIKKWLALNQKTYRKTGKFWERYDVVKGDLGRTERYAVQSGFGWTNGVFIRMTKELEALDSSRRI